MLDGLTGDLWYVVFTAIKHIKRRLWLTLNLLNINMLAGTVSQSH